MEMLKKMSCFYSYIPNLVMLWQHYETFMSFKKKIKIKKHSDEKKIKIGRSEM